MFADPQTITIGGVAVSLNKINQDGYSSEYLYRSATEEYRLFIRNTSGTNKAMGPVRVDRHNVELRHTIFAVAPSTTNTVRQVYFVINHQVGDTLTGPTAEVSGLFAWATASSNANITKLFNSES